MKKDSVRSIKTFNLIYFVEKGTSDSRYKQRQKFFCLCYRLWTSSEDCVYAYVLFGLSFLSLGLQPAVKPAEEESLPHYSVLRFEYPVVFVREDYHLGGNTAELGCVKCHFALR